MSRLVRRPPMAARVVDGAWRSCNVASGLIWGPVKRIELHFELRSAILRFVTAREQAVSQSKRMLAVLVPVPSEWSRIKSIRHSSASSWSLRSFISCRAGNDAIARRRQVRSLLVSVRLVCSRSRRLCSWDISGFSDPNVRSVRAHPVFCS